MSEKLNTDLVSSELQPQDLLPIQKKNIKILKNILEEAVTQKSLQATYDLQLKFQETMDKAFAILEEISMQQVVLRRHKKEILKSSKISSRAYSQRN